ncbi:MAG: adenosylcobinamide-phosphate synthase CbiB [Candidatus Desulfacyla sp.]
MLELSAIMVLAYVLDLFFGDPRYPCHPVRIIGLTISLVGRPLKALRLDGKVGGILLACITVGFTLGAYIALRRFLHGLFPLVGLGFDLFICYSLLAFKDLIVHIKPVIRALETNDLAGARKAVSMTVGRDVRYLDREGVSRAAVETLAENFVDGFLSPLFWYVTAGAAASFLGWPPLMPAICLMLLFKVASTLDSMVGYKTGPFPAFGWAGARLDDLLNFIPARLSLAILFVGAWTSGLHPKDGLKVALRDRLKHESPNSAHAESFAAGSLHIRLGGPTRYPDGLKEKPWLGRGYDDPGPDEIHRTIHLLNRSAATAVLLSLSMFLIVQQVP